MSEPLRFERDSATTELPRDPEAGGKSRFYTPPRILSADPLEAGACVCDGTGCGKPEKLGCGSVGS